MIEAKITTELGHIKLQRVEGTSNINVLIDRKNSGQISLDVPMRELVRAVDVLR